VADLVAPGTVVSAGSYKCSNCGHVLRLHSNESLPPCPNCAGPGLGQGWEALSGDDSVEAPFPDQN
jgi:zinc ribbon family protein